MKKQVIMILAMGIGAVSLASVPSSAKTGEAGANIQNAGLVLDIGFKKKRHHRNHRYWHGYNDFGSYHYGGNCRYYKKKARWSGSRYWWKKYRRCMRRNHFDY